MNMKKRVEDCSRQWSQSYSRPTIYKVPLTICQCDKAAYQPQFISIGPYHRHSGGNNGLRAMERHKWRYLHDFLSRNPHHSFDDYFKEVEKLEERARGCYSVEIDLLEFTEVMVLDGCFVIELFLKLWEGRADKAMEAKEYDPVYSHSWVINGVSRDLLLLENQLPFFILDYLYGTLNVSTPSMVEIALNFFSILKAWKWGTGTVVPDHLLHLVHFHLFYLPLIPSRHLLSYSLSSTTHGRSWPKVSTGTVPSTTRLKDVGVKFSKQKVPKSPLDITFNMSSGKMEIPYLCVDDDTNSIFRNFVALEQCLPSTGVEFTNYVSFMGDIMNNAQDVEILRSHGIIENLLGSDEEVALLFHRMGKGIMIGEGASGSHIWQLKVNLNQYSQTLIYAKKKIMNDYFGSYFGGRWSFFSVMVAAFLILLTLLQTIFAFLSYFQASS